MLRALSKDPRRWKKIYCLSRRPPLVLGGLPDHVQHVALDFLKPPIKIAAGLEASHVTADHIFFFSSLQPAPKPGEGLWSDTKEMVRVNTLLLDNFLEALSIANIKPTRFMLQTGAKTYGGHLGPTKVPQEKTDPRVTLEPNFYYPQEDAVTAWCAAHNAGWNVLIPGPILGAVPDAAMNAAFPLAVYAAVSKQLGQPLVFPGDAASWQMNQSMSSAMMNAFMEEWAVLGGPKDQRYNACDSSAFTWGKAWPRIAGWYGIESKGPCEGPFMERETPHNPRGYGPKGVVRRAYTMVGWAKEDEVVAAWKQLAEKHDLSSKELLDVDRVFGFLDGTLCRAAPLSLSIDKSRKLGWHGFVDSTESILQVFDDLAKLKMIPPVPRFAVQFN